MSYYFNYCFFPFFLCVGMLVWFFWSPVYMGTHLLHWLAAVRPTSHFRSFYVCVGVFPGFVSSEWSPLVWIALWAVLTVLPPDWICCSNCCWMHQIPEWLQVFISPTICSALFCIWDHSETAVNLCHLCVHACTASAHMCTVHCIYRQR